MKGLKNQSPVDYGSNNEICIAGELAKLDSSLRYVRMFVCRLCLTTTASKIYITTLVITLIVLPAILNSRYQKQQSQLLNEVK